MISNPLSKVHQLCGGLSILDPRLNFHVHLVRQIGNSQALHSRRDMLGMTQDR